jgi:hypothetical protein
MIPVTPCLSRANEFRGQGNSGETILDSQAGVRFGHLIEPGWRVPESDSEGAGGRDVSASPGGTGVRVGARSDRSGGLSRGRRDEAPTGRADGTMMSGGVSEGRRRGLCSFARLAAPPVLGDGVGLAVAKSEILQFEAILGRPGWSGRGRGA